MPTKSMTLAELIKQHQTSTGESYADIAERSGLSRAKVGQIALAEPWVNPPRPETLRKLAVGLRLPLHLVHRAFMASYGLLAPEDGVDGDVALLVERYRALSRDAQLLINDLVSVITERESRRA